MDDDPFDLGGSPRHAPSRGNDAEVGDLPIKIRIMRTEEQTSLMVQRYTAYVIDISDFGRNFEVSHRYGDFEALHKNMLTECPSLNLPPMPPKGVDGTDANVVAMRKVELEKQLRFMLSSAEVLMEKQLHFWKFLNLPNPAVIAARFAIVGRARPTALKTLVKMSDPKYKEDIYRLSHPRIIELLVDGLKELGKPSWDSSHWALQQGGRNAVCQVLSTALGHSDDARQRFLDAGVLRFLLGIAEREEAALDDARIALNVIVTREADRFGVLLASILKAGGMSQLLTLAQRTKSQEFVAKLLWLAWEGPVRSCFAQPGGHGLRLLQALLQSSVATCSLLGAVLLAGMVAGGDFNNDPSHRTEALKMVKNILERPEAASDPQFSKSLCGSPAAVSRLCVLVDDPDLSASILALLCAARLPAAKLTKMTKSLSSIVSDRGATAAHSEESRARAAELLLHVQGGGAAPPSAAGSFSSGPGGFDSKGNSASAPTSSAAPAMTLENCEGLVAHEDSIERALKTQLEEGVNKSRSALSERTEMLAEVKGVVQQRLQPLPLLDFKTFDSSLSSFMGSREELSKLVRDAQSLSQNMESKLTELTNARPSSVDPHIYRQRLELAERLYAEVKQQREATAAAESLATEKRQRAEESQAAATRASGKHKQFEAEISSLRSQKCEKETEAIKLRHRCSTPNLDSMKRQAAEALERNLAQARELQTIGQRVNQGDPDYLKAGETREAKIADLASKLAQLKKQHQVLLTQQKELDFNPEEIAERARAAEADAQQLQIRADGLQTQHAEAEREWWEATRRASQESEEARTAQDRRASEASRLQAMETEATSQLSLLQPMIQETHSGWQRLLELRKRLDSDQRGLGSRLDEAKAALDTEASRRTVLVGQCQELIGTLQNLLVNLDAMGGAGVAAGHPSGAAAGYPTATGPAAAATVPEVPTLAPATSVNAGASASHAAALFEDDLVGSGHARTDGLFDDDDAGFALNPPAPVEPVPALAPVSPSPAPTLVPAPAGPAPPPAAPSTPAQQTPDEFGEDEFGTL